MSEFSTFLTALQQRCSKLRTHAITTKMKFRLYTRRTIVRRELGRTRANSRELGRTPREFASSSPTPTLRRTPPNVRRSTPNVRRSSAEFARVRPSSRVLRRELANGSPENSFAGRNLNQRSPRTRSAANEVRRERGSPRTRFVANYVRGERQLWRTRSPKTSRKCRL